jgi:hypothetical protein
VIPQSALIKAISFAVFGFTMPKTTTGSHLIQPINPFKPFETDALYRKAIMEYYPEEHHGEDLLDFGSDQVLSEQ